MRSSSASYLIAGLNFGSAGINFVGLIQNVNANSSFAFVNMFFIFLGVFFGGVLLSVGGEQERQGN